MGQEVPGDGQPEATNERSRRPAALMVLGAFLLLAALTVAVISESSPDDEAVEPVPGTGQPELGPVAPGDEGPDWSLVLAATGALTGVGTFALGLADFTRNTMRYRREHPPPESDWRDTGGYR